MELLFLHYHGYTNENAKLIIHVNIGNKTGKITVPIVKILNVKIVLVFLST